MPAGSLRFMLESTYTIKPLDESTWAAFAALVERNNGIFGGCWCMAFHPEGGDRAAQGELNRERSGSGRAGAAFRAEGGPGKHQGEALRAAHGGQTRATIRAARGLRVGGGAAVGTVQGLNVCHQRPRLPIRIERISQTATRLTVSERAAA